MAADPDQADHDGDGEGDACDVVFESALLPTPGVRHLAVGGGAVWLALWGAQRRWQFERWTVERDLLVGEVVGDDRVLDRREKRVDGLAARSDGLLMVVGAGAIARRTPAGHWSHIPAVAPGTAVEHAATDTRGVAFAHRLPETYYLVDGPGEEQDPPDRLYAEQGGRWSVFTEGVTLPGGFPYHVAVSPSDEVWVASRAGVARRKGDGSWETFAYPEELPAPGAFRTDFDGRGDAWVTLREPADDGSGILVGVARIGSDAPCAALGVRARFFATDDAGRRWLLGEDGLVSLSEDCSAGPPDPGRVLRDAPDLTAAPKTIGLARGPDGRVWIATKPGVVRRGRDRIVETTLDILQPAAGRPVDLVVVDGETWLLDDGGLTRWNDREERVQQWTARELGVGEPAALARAGGTLYAGGTEGLAWLDAEGGWSRRGDPFEVRRLAADGETLWVLTPGRLLRYADEDPWLEVALPEVGPVHALAVRDAEVWLAHEVDRETDELALLSTLSPTPLQSWTLPTVRDLAVAGDEVWVATRVSGARLRASGGWLVYTERNAGLSPGPFGPIAVDAATPWLVSSEGVDRLSGLDDVVTLQRSRLVQGGRPEVLLYGPRGEIIVRDTAGAAYALDPNQSPRPWTTAPAAISATTLPDGTYCQGTEGHGLLIGRRWVTTADGLPSDVVRSLAVGPDGVLWVGTDAGVVHVADGVVVDPGLIGERTNGFAFGPDGEVWAATRVGAVHVADGVTTRYAGQRWGLTHNHTVGVAYLPDGRLWIVTMSEVAEWTGEGFEVVPTPTEGRAVFGGLALLGDGRVLVPNYDHRAPVVVFERTGAVVGYPQEDLPGGVNPTQALADPFDPHAAWVLTERGVLRFVGGPAARPGPP